jgi:MoaA/NifB/PqqE/SkfB family radical SAM enzyme
MKTGVAASTLPVTFLWLEVTGKCQLKCVHCYADSGPGGRHSSLEVETWRDVIGQGAALGVRMVQFIGGEPTLYPALPDLIDHALDLDVEVEVFSNLVHVSPRLWATFEKPGVRLATSYYTDSPDQHSAITQRDTHRQTRANIGEAVRRGIRLRAGVVGIGDGQRVDQAYKQLRDVGVAEIGFDELRQVGRGGRAGGEDVEQLCGNCGHGVAAVGPNGDVWPCVFSRWLPAGNVTDASLTEILAGERWLTTQRRLGEQFAQRDGRHEAGGVSWPCVPNMCNPQCGPSCSPACRPANNCRPVGACVPSYR